MIVRGVPQQGLAQYAHIGYLPLVNVETIILIKALVSISVHRGTTSHFMPLFILEVMPSKCGMALSAIF